jgi:hypothetical protein
LQDIASSDFTPTDYPYDFYAYHEPTSTWVNQKNTTDPPTFIQVNGASFSPACGYLVAYDQLTPVISFQGTLHNGSISAPVTVSSSTPSLAGINLLGNPYPGPIDWKASNGWTRSVLNTSSGGYDFWVWNDALGNYGTYNSALSGSTGTLGTSQYIAPGQGFFVSAASAGNVSFTNDVRTDQSSTFLKSTASDLPMLSLKVSGGSTSYTDELLLQFSPSLHNCGTAKLQGFYPDAPMLYATADNAEYAILFLGAPSSVTVPVGLRSGSSGSFTISASHLESFPAQTTISLIDTHTGSTHDLSASPQYTFSAAESNAPNRFLLQFGGTIGLSEQGTSSPLTAYLSGGNVCVVIPQSATGSSLSVYNHLGQLVFTSQQAPSGSVFTLPQRLGTGFYVISVTNGTRLYTTKLILP